MEILFNLCPNIVWLGYDEWDFNQTSYLLASVQKVQPYVCVCWQKTTEQKRRKHQKDKIMFIKLVVFDIRSKSMWRQRTTENLKMMLPFSGPNNKWTNANYGCKMARLSNQSVQCDSIFAELMNKLELFTQEDSLLEW